MPTPSDDLEARIREAVLAGIHAAFVGRTEQLEKLMASHAL